MSTTLLSQDVLPESALHCDESTSNAVTSSTDMEQQNPEASHFTDAVYDALLDNQMAALALNTAEANTTPPVSELPPLDPKDLNCGSGSDSGVDFTANAPLTSDTSNNATALQRALSSNSGGYASSNGGLDDTTTNTNTTNTPAPNVSCDSSMISCSSELYDARAAGESGDSAGSLSGIVGACRMSSVNYECCSENGSESSSVTGSAAIVRRSNSVKKKVALFEPAERATPIKTASKSPRDCSTPTSTNSAGSGSAMRPRMSVIKRTASLSRGTPVANTTAAQARERLHESKQASSSKTMTPCMTPTNVFRVTQPRASKPQKPDSLPNTLNRTQSMSMQRLVQRTPSLSRARTPCTPSDDGRWPGNTGRTVNAKRGMSVTPDLTSLKIRSNLLSTTEMASTLSANPYSTLPRRRKQKSVEDLTARDSRNSSISRDSRMVSSVVLSSRKNLVSAYGPAASTPTSGGGQQTRYLSQSARKASQQPSAKTLIYHETSVQTALTSDDLEKLLGGGTLSTRPLDAAEQRDQQTQSDIRDIELERLRDEVRQLSQREHDLSAKLQREREEKLSMQRELHLNTERVMNMLELARVAGRSAGKCSEAMTDVTTPTSDDGGSGHDSLLMLESQIQMSGHELIERQQEIGQLRQLCRSLQVEMERSLQVQACLLQERDAIEQESSELQDFLQHEKSALCEALKELEGEHQSCKQQLVSRDEEIKVLRDECRHLVRLNEQRRQENRMLQTKYAALENKSKELMLQQNYSVSGASAALSGLHSRLDSLVEQLVSTYNITENDLEDIGFQSESHTHNGNGGNGVADANGGDQCEHQMQRSTYTNGGLMCAPAHPQLPQPSDGSLSPQRNQSFIAAVISAIRNATTPGGKKLSARSIKRNGTGLGYSVPNHNGNRNNCKEEIQNGDESDSTEMLDSETEPCLMMDNVLEDVPMPDSHSHNMVSSCTGMISQIELPTELINTTTGDESLHNLSQAITNRQQMELQIGAMNLQKTAANMQLSQQQDNSQNSEDVSCHDSLADMPSLAEYCTAQAVVDQVIEVDSLVTKLLKVLRLIQMDNDNCIQQLIVDKNKLQEHKEDMLEKIKDLEDEHVKLQDELMDATQELMLKNNDLANTKAEMQRHRNEIDRLTQDICNLSTLCSNYKKLSPTVEFSPLQQQLMAVPTTPNDADELDNEAAGIINLLKMWQAEGQLQHASVRKYLRNLYKTKELPVALPPEHDERLRIYANQLEHVLKVLESSGQLMETCPDLQQLRKDIEFVKLNANWTNFITNERNERAMDAADPNANEAN